MKPFLETLSGDTTGAAGYSHVSGADLASGFGAKGAANERKPGAASGTVSKKGLVLLVEADASFRGIIADCLTENGSASASCFQAPSATVAE